MRKMTWKSCLSLKHIHRWWAVLKIVPQPDNRGARPVVASHFRDNTLSVFFIVSGLHWIKKKMHSQTSDLPDGAYQRWTCFDTKPSSASYSILVVIKNLHFFFCNFNFVHFLKFLYRFILDIHQTFILDYCTYCIHYNIFTHFIKVDRLHEKHVLA